MGNLRHRVTRQRRRGEGGFTLIELLVVISILSVLAAIVIINVTGVKNTANAAACNSDQQVLQTASDDYYQASNDVYAANVSALVPTYIHTAPNDIDRSGKTVTWSIDQTTGNVIASPTCSS
jgi:prepilin-type N-terminal cleavage/methylation domain-containing protein